MMFARAYMRESQEMVLDAHDRAFAFFKGACTRGIYDNMKTAVEAIFAGKERQYNRRFIQMCSHYLVQPPSIGLGPMAPQWTALHPGIGMGRASESPSVRDRWRGSGREPGRFDPGAVLHAPRSGDQPR